MDNKLIAFPSTIQLFVDSEQLINQLLQQPLEAIIKQLSLNHSWLEIMEAVTKVERDKQNLQEQQNQAEFNQQIAVLDHQLKTDREAVEKEHQQNIERIKKQALIEAPDPVTATPVTETTKKSFHEIICAYEGCRRSFQSKNSSARYCSTKCRNKRYIIQAEEPTEITRNCPNCEKPFKVFHFGNNKKYCSQICWSRHYRATHKEQYTSYQEKWKSKKILPQPEQPLEEAERLAQQKLVNQPN